MRRSGRLLVTAVVGAMLAVPAEVSANGGAYLELDETHYVPGAKGTIVTYVSVPKRQRPILERGPFYVFLLPEGGSIREGRRIPDGAIRLGTLMIEKEKDSYELSTSFMTPSLATGFYQLGVCNDPCTISGFREPLTGAISIVATALDGELLTRNERLEGRIFGLRRQIRRSERRGEGFETQLNLATAEKSRLSSEVGRLEDELAAARQQATAAFPEGPFAPWLVAALFAAALFAVAVTMRRRRKVLAKTEARRALTRPEDSIDADATGGSAGRSADAPVVRSTSRSS